MGKPAWRGAFDWVERAVGAPLEEAVASRRYVDVLVFWMNGPLAVNQMLCRLADDQLGRVLHLLNMPSRDDVTRLSRQITILTAEVRALSLPADRIEGLVADWAGSEVRTTAISESGPDAVSGPPRSILRGDGGP
jgi:hypothetical protein